MLKFLVESPYERKLYRLGGESVLIGRSRAAEIPLLDEKAQKRHVLLTRKSGGWRFRDLSGGRTLVNGGAEEEGPLRVGDRLEIGSTLITLQAVLHTEQVVKAAAPSESAVPDPEIDARSVRLDPGSDEKFLTGGFRSILEINKRLVRAGEEGKLLHRIMDAAIDLTGAERGFLVLKVGDGFRIRVARNLEGDPLANPEVEISRTIALRAMKERRAILSADAGTDERWAGMESIAGLRLLSVLSVPLLSEDRVLGSLYVDHRDERGIFTQRHVSLLEAFADQASLAIVSARRIGEMRRRGEELERKNREVRELNARLASDLDRVREDLRSRQGELEFRYDYRQIVGRSAPMREVLTTLDKITDLNVPVFIEGESGTGKELVARATHFNGPRKDARFVTENCSAIPETLIEKVLFGHVKGAFTGAGSDAPGLFEQADGGTLFLDEVGDMSPELQKKILRVLEEGEIRRVGGKEVRPVDVRIICATNRDVDRLRAEGEFREDLYWRLVVVRIHLPPLRERPEDIPLLVDHFLDLYAKEMDSGPRTLTGAALDFLSRHPWPGNVRELANEIRRAVALSGERITPESLSPRVRGLEGPPALHLSEGRKLRDVVGDVERALIGKALARFDGNKTRAADHLGLSRLGLRNKMERYGLASE